MNPEQWNDANPDRRGFLKSAAAGLAGAGFASGAPADTAARPLTEKRNWTGWLPTPGPSATFSRRGSAATTPQCDDLKSKYGEITMLDFPQFTKDTFPGRVPHGPVFRALSATWPTTACTCRCR